MKAFSIYGTASVAISSLYLAWTTLPKEWRWWIATIIALVTVLDAFSTG
jgi:hypothetical protein